MSFFKYILIPIWLLCAGLSLPAQEVKLPPHYKLYYEVLGDLDKDGISERAVIYDVPDSTDSLGGTPRELIIYKNTGGKWVIWQRSRSAILDSKSGGMMGDPFQELEIDNGILKILQAGGSSWHWSRYDKYRFQNGRFELIGYTSEFGKHCVEWTSIDYNISTGRISARKTYDQCDDNGENLKTVKEEKEQFSHKLNTLVHLGNRNEAEVKIVSPKYKFELYL